MDELEKRPDAKPTHRAISRGVGRELMEDYPPYELPDEPPRPLAPRTRLILGVAALVLAVISMFPLGGVFSSADTYGSQITQLDAKATRVTRMVAFTTAGSAIISALPDDTGTPMADKLIDVGSDFALVLAVIYLEKYLLTIFGFAAFRFLFPAALIAFAVWCWQQYNRRGMIARVLGVRLAAMGLVMACVLPVSVELSTLITDTYQAEANNSVIAAATEGRGIEALIGEDEAASATDTSGAQAQGSAETSGSTATDKSGSSASATTGSTDEAAAQNPFTAATEWLSGLASGVTEGASALLARVETIFNDLVEAFAVYMVTDCVVPVVVLFLFVKLVNMIMGTAFTVSWSARPRFHR